MIFIAIFAADQRLGHPEFGVARERAGLEGQIGCGAQRCDAEIRIVALPGFAAKSAGMTSLAACASPEGEKA